MNRLGATYFSLQLDMPQFLSLYLKVTVSISSTLNTSMSSVTTHNLHPV